MYYGTILGLLIGFCVGLLTRSSVVMIAGSVAGAILGMRFDFSRTQPLTPSAADEELPPYKDELETTLKPGAAERLRETADALAARASFAESLCGVFVAVARADGELTRDEVRVVREFFEQELRYSPGELEAVRVALKAAAANPPELAKAAQHSAEKLSPAERLLFINALYEMALADGPLGKAEADSLKLVGVHLSIAHEDLQSIRASHLGTGLQHFEALGVSAEASDDELKRAYKRLAALHHPDRVAHLGPGAVSRAARRFQEIQAAWAEVRKVRGL
ncbi:MAG: TerB family tellurite resistance protein [Myxococcaceae bacterium]